MMGLVIIPNAGLTWFKSSPNPWLPKYICIEPWIPHQFSSWCISGTRAVLCDTHRHHLMAAGNQSYEFKKGVRQQTQGLRSGSGMVVIPSFTGQYNNVFFHHKYITCSILTTWLLNTLKKSSGRDTGCMLKWTKNSCSGCYFDPSKVLIKQQ